MVELVAEGDEPLDRGRNLDLPDAGLFDVRLRVRASLQVLS